MIDFLRQAIHLWIKGGPAMVALTVLAFFIYYSGLRLYFILKVWQAKPNLLPAFFEKEPASLDKINNRFEQLQSFLFARIDRRIRFLVILTGATPLLGLLGTVMGILTTFRGLAAENAQSSLDLISGGIAEALLTTQAGLTIAIPAFFLIYLIQRRQLALKLALTSAEGKLLRKLAHPTTLS